MMAVTPRRIEVEGIDSRKPVPAQLSVPEAVLSACRAASLHIGTPNLTNLGITSTLRGEGRTTIAVAMAVRIRTILKIDLVMAPCSD